MAKIHPMAIVDAGAKLADDVEIGPFCTIGPHATIGAGSRLISHVNVTGHTTLGERTIVHPFASLGSPPQSVGYRNEPTTLIVGDDCIIRESVTMNTGTAEGNGVTRVGSRGFFMISAHIGHDCTIGDNVIFANGAAVGGHCEIGDHVFIGGLTAIQQFTRIGAHAMLGGCSGITSDVIPFGMASGDRARMVGINMVGMKRRGFDPDSIRAVRSVYRQLFLSDTLEHGIDIAAGEHGDDAAVQKLLDFVRARGNRHLCRPDN